MRYAGVRWRPVLMTLLLAAGADVEACSGPPKGPGSPRDAEIRTDSATPSPRKPLDGVLRLERRLGRVIECSERTRERRLARSVGRLGEPQILLAGLGALYLTGNRTERRAVRDSLLVAVQVSLTSRLAKMLFGRSRPRQGRGEFRGPTLGADSFPSGHTALVFGVAAAYGRHRRSASDLAHGLAALVGWSRVAEGAHWPADVAAGAALGLTMGAR